MTSSQIQYICILFWVLNIMYLMREDDHYWPKCAACVDVTNKIYFGWQYTFISF